MTPFLHQVARYYIETQGLEDYCFVFPNRRSGQFFLHYLQQQFVAADGRPHLMPCVTSINELVAELTGTVVATDIEMVFALYDAYCDAMGDKAQEFDKFIYWAQLIISDFNDIDRSLADAGGIYRNLDDLHGLSANYLTAEVQEKVRKIFGDSLFTSFFDTSADADMWQHRSAQSHEGDDRVKVEFMSLWNALETIYRNYHKTLQGKGVVSPGYQLRMAAEGDKRQLPYTRLVFVGFGVLSAAEVKLFDFFKQEGKADFWWDNAGIRSMLDKAPSDPGALLIDGYCKRFGAKDIEPVNLDGAAIRVLSVPSNVAQAKQAVEEVHLMTSSDQVGPGIDTAIVLPDEGLLVPLLHSLHGISRLNVTLGYPLHSSGIVSLMHIVARMHHQASPEHGVWTYYREDVNDILSHPLIKTYFTDEALSMVTELARTNRYRVPAVEFEGLAFADLFAVAMASDSSTSEREQHVDYLNHLLSFCNLLMARMQSSNESAGDSDDDEDDSTATMPLQQAFLTMYIDVLNQLKSSLSQCGQTIQRTTVFYMIDRLTSAAIVPFTGEPLQGMQVMGLLETRSLDFKNLVILSMNERVFPKGRSINSFIPNYIRRANGMSTIEQQEAIVSFNFYRLLNRAVNVSLIYDSSAQKLGSSEPSRYINQLEKIYGLQPEHVEVDVKIKTSAPIAISVPNDLGLRERYTGDVESGDGRYLSASAINKFINCPLQYYMHYVQELNDDNELSDFMDYGTFGTIIHDTLSECYDSPQVKERGGLIDRQYLEFFKKSKLEAVVVRNIKKTYLHVPEERLDDSTQPLSGEAFMLIDTIKSYMGFVLDYDMELIGNQGAFTVLECEQTHKMPQMEVGGESFNFTYKPDRIDRLSNGTVRIVDYKTGKDETGFSKLDDLFKRDMDKRRKAILQLFLYSYAYLKEFPEVKSVMPVIYKLSSMKDSGVMLKTARGVAGAQYVFSMDDPVAQEFITLMGETVGSIYDDDFVQVPENPKSGCCNYCRFIDFCRRTPKKNR